MYNDDTRHRYCPSCGYHGTAPGMHHSSYCPGFDAPYSPASCPAIVCRIAPASVTL